MSAYKIFGIKTSKGKLACMLPSCPGSDPPLATKNSRNPRIKDKDGEVIVHVHAAPLKSVDKQLAKRVALCKRAENCPASAARMELGISTTGSASSLVLPSTTSWCDGTAYSCAARIHFSNPGKRD